MFFFGGGWVVDVRPIGQSFLEAAAQSQHPPAPRTDAAFLRYVPQIIIKMKNQRRDAGNTDSKRLNVESGKLFKAREGLNASQFFQAVPLGLFLDTFMC